MISLIYRDVESRALELENQVKRLKQLFKPWPPPRKEEEGNSTTEQKLEMAEPHAAEVIPVEEQAELDKIDKLLNKAHIARKAHKKTVQEIQTETSVSEQSQNSLENDKDLTSKLHNKSKEENTNGKDLETGEKNKRLLNSETVHQKKAPKTENILSSNLNQKKNVLSISSVTKTKTTTETSNTVSKPAKISVERTKQTVAAKSLSAQSKRPGSSSGKKKVVPAHINAPFQTNPNLPTSKLQTTYRSATSAKSSLRGRVNVSSAKGRGSLYGTAKGSCSTSTSAKVGPGQLTNERSNSSIKDSIDESKAHCDNSKSKEDAVLVKDERIKQSMKNARVNESEKAEDDEVGPNVYVNCDNSNGSEMNRNSKLHNTGNQSKAVIDKRMNEGDQLNLEDDTGKLFDLRKNGSAIEIPLKLKKYFSHNTRLRRKYQTQTLTRKVNAPSSSQNFSSLLEQTEKFDDNTTVQSLAKQAETITRTYKHLSGVLESLHLDLISDQSPPGELLHCKTLLEFLLTKFQETEELFHKTDFRLLRTVPTASNISQLRLTRPTQSPTIWYSKFSSLPGHRPPESVVYNSCKDLERYRSLVFQNQLITAQLEVMDSSANLILPVLKSINPASSEFLSVLRCAYEILSLRSNTSPVVVKDTIEEVL